MSLQADVSEASVNEKEGGGPRITMCRIFIILSLNFYYALSHNT